MLTVAVVSPTAKGRGDSRRSMLAYVADERWDELHVIYDTMACPARARNRGWRKSRADLIAFIDDDVLVDPGALNLARLWFEDDRELMLGQAAIRGGFTTSETFMFLTTFMVVRRDWLLMLGGFDERFGYAKPEADLEFGWRTLDRGGKVTFMPDVTAEHPNESKSSWTAENMQMMSELHPARWEKLVEEDNSWGPA